MCVCTSCVWESIMCHGACEEVWAWLWVSILTSHLVWESLLSFVIPYAKLVGLWASGFSCFCLPSYCRNPVEIIETRALMSGFPVGSGNLNSGPLICVASTLSNESLSEFLYYKLFFPVNLLAYSDFLKTGFFSFRVPVDGDGWQTRTVHYFSCLQWTLPHSASLTGHHMAVHSLFNPLIPIHEEF